ncbi:MAG: cytochrome c [Gammaproteobacteria bacterium]|nr:cytochrome c [Gammaproteobacteria bacterium]
MYKATRIIILTTGLILAAPGIAADKDPNLKLIKARQGEMQLRSFNAGPLFGMAKGKIAYNAELASTLANNLATQLKLDMGRAWPKDTDNVAYKGKTTALPKIWTTYPDIAEKGKAYARAVNELAAVAGNGLDALKSKIGALGKGCKGCHDNFRKKK